MTNRQSQHARRAHEAVAEADLVAESGVPIDATLTRQLLINIFYPIGVAFDSCDAGEPPCSRGPAGAIKILRAPLADTI